jgi:hypothetical protein
MIVDLFLVYQFIRRLATPFNKWKAYETGVIDDKGKILVKKKDRTDAQKKSWQIFDVMIANLKKLLAKIPGGSSRLASYVAALYLIREWNHFTDGTLLTEDLNEEDLEESLSVFNDLYVNYITEETNVKALITEAAAPRWKKAGPNGEKEITFPNGRKFMLDKNLDHNERHTGEWKVFEWDKKKREWSWVDTYSPQWHAKDMVMKMGGLKENKKINTKPSLEETPVNSVGSGNIAGMDGSAFSKEAQKRWTSQNKSKKKKLRDIMGDKL